MLDHVENKPVLPVYVSAQTDLSNDPFINIKSDQEVILKTTLTRIERYLLREANRDRLPTARLKAVTSLSKLSEPWGPKVLMP